MVTPPHAGRILQRCAQQRRRNGRERYPTVAHPTTGEHAEGEHSQNRAIGVARHLVDEVDDAVVAEGLETEDQQPHEHGHAHVHPPADAGQPAFVVTARTLQDIDRKGGGERRERRTRRRIGARNQSHDEQDADGRRQTAADGDEREDLVALFGHRKGIGIHIEVEEDAQHQEEVDDHHLTECRQHDVFLRIARRGAAQIALHHVLIEPRHGDEREDAGPEHLPEIVRRTGIVEEENLRVGALPHGFERRRERQSQFPHDEYDAEHDASDQADRFERVGPDQRLDAALLRIEPDEEHRDGHVDPERQSVVVEDEQLHDGADDIDAQCGAERFGDEEEPGPRAVGAHAEPVVEILVERHHFHLIEERDQHEGDDHLPYRESQHHLHVGEGAGGHRPGHRNEGHARYGCADHGQSGHIPWSAAVAREETGVVGLAARKVGDDEQDGDVDGDREDDCCWGHEAFF